MTYRKLSANYIFSAHTGFLKNGILILDKDNIVIDLTDTKGDLREIANLEHYNGILTPGFVNTQCPVDASQLLLREMFAVQQLDPLINLKDLLLLATLDAAKDLGIDEKLGSFEKGKQPGVFLIQQADLQKLKLTESSRIIKLA